MLAGGLAMHCKNTLPGFAEKIGLLYGHSGTEF